MRQVFENWVVRWVSGSGYRLKQTLYVSELMEEDVPRNGGLFPWPLWLTFSIERVSFI